MPKDNAYDGAIDMYGNALGPVEAGEQNAASPHTKRKASVGELEIHEHADLTYTSHLVHGGTLAVRVDSAKRPTVAAAKASAHQMLVTSGVAVPGDVPTPRQLGQAAPASGIVERPGKAKREAG